MFFLYVILFLFFVRGTLNAVPLNVTPQPTSSLTRLQSIDDICEEGEEDYLKEEENKDNKIDHGQNNIIVTAQSSSMAAVICQCRQLIPFLHLTNSLEDKCSELFRTVYKRSCMGFNEKTKTIEEQVNSDEFFLLHFLLVELYFVILFTLRAQ